MSKVPDETSSSAPLETSKVPTVTPHRRSTLDYFNPGNAGDRFWRLFSSRDKVIENLKTFFWVVPITMVIWIYAEREQIVVPTGPNVSNVSIMIESNDDKRYVEMVGGNEHTVNLKLTGPQQAFEKVRAQLISNIPRGLKIELGSGMPIGKNQPVNIVDRIQNMELFRNNGVTVEEAQPQALLVNVDELIHPEIAVQVPPGITNLTADTHFDPPKVRVSGPKSLLSPLVETNTLKVFASLSGNELLKSEGPHTIPAVKVSLFPNQDGLRIDPAQVKAEIVVRALDVPYVIPTVPIHVDIAPGTSKNFDYTITNGDAISNVHVSGPEEKINQLKDNSFSAKAILEIVPDDSALGPTKKPVTYFLPEGVTVSSPEDKAYQVEFTLIRKP